MVDGASLGRRLSRGAPLGRVLCLLRRSCLGLVTLERLLGRHFALRSQAGPWAVQLALLISARHLFRKTLKVLISARHLFRKTLKNLISARHLFRKTLKEVNESMSMTHSREGTFAGSLKHPCQNLHSRGTAQSSNEVDRCKMSTPNRCNAGSSKTRHLLELTDPCMGHYAFFLLSEHIL